MLARFSNKIDASLDAALGAVQTVTSTSKIKDSTATEKGDPDVGHHAIVTPADRIAQRFILESLRAEFPTAVFITEEKESHPGILCGNELELANQPLVFIVDPLDGSSGHARGMYEWSVSIGVVEHGEHRGGAIVAPDVLHFLCVVGERGKGVAAKWLRTGFEPVHCAETACKDSTVHIGVDFFFLPQFNRFINAFSSEIRTTRTAGSCALGLACLASGRIDGLVMPVQSCWDWAAGYPLVEEAGGKFQFYRYCEGEIVLMDQPDPLTYSTVRRNTAFVAGNPELVDWLTGLLVENYRKA